MWAQGKLPRTSYFERSSQSGLTVGVLIASALVAGTTSGEGKPVERVDHSWEDILGMHFLTCHNLLLTRYRGRGTDEARGQDGDP